MLIIKTTKELNYHIVSLKKEGLKIGFVPTMGALHEGHISLIKRSNKENNLTVCSIFVNPTQFNDPKDFEKYPITLESDIAKLKKAKCDFLFLPSVDEMYPKGYGNKEKIDFGYLAETLEGEFRPGHFDGMAQIVEKLLRAAEPHHLYMGQKDYQQAMICTKMIKVRKLKVKLVLCPIAREKDGLAMSSRNVRLDKKSRLLAVEISKVLKSIKRQVASLKLRTKSQESREVQAIEAAAKEKLTTHKEFKVEYVAIRDAKTLKPFKTLKPDTEAVALVAAWIGGVRLIDNMLV